MARVDALLQYGSFHFADISSSGFSSDKHTLAKTAQAVSAVGKQPLVMIAAWKAVSISELLLRSNASN